MESDQQVSKADRILEAAVDLFIERGFSETPMDAIAERAGVAKGTLYYHFKSKEGIVDALLERFGARIDEEIGPLIAESDMQFPEKSAHMTALLSKLFRTNFARLHKMRYIDVHEKTAVVTLRHLVPHYVRLIEQGEKEGLCSAEHAEGFSEVLVASSLFLLDPQFGIERMTIHAEALSLMAERAFGFKPGTFRLFPAATELAKAMGNGPA